MTIDTNKLKALALAAEKNGEHIYTHPCDSNKWKDNEAWQLAASPEAFSELIAERDELRAEVERLRAELARDQSGAKTPETRMGAAFEGGPSDVERDAMRYRWLRNKANSQLGRAPMVFNCNPEDALCWTDSLHGTRLDAVMDVFVDAAIEKEKA